ncbi:TIGR00297 family protein [archaeon SCG-AAA382B04]|nr:TIGR00297 family protein [archaeon SCG-AAA382B04]
MNVITGVGICAALSVLAFQKKILSKKAVIASFLVGSVVAVLGGLKWLTVLLTFVIIGFSFTKIGYNEKKQRGLLEGEHGERKMRNVLANGIVPIGIVIIYWLYTSLGTSYGVLSIETTSPQVLLLLKAGYIGSVATAASDTLASEIGTLDSHTRLITNMKKVEPGSDGGISLLGELSSVLGALIIGVVSFFLFSLQNAVVIALIAGVIGCHLDSFLGATMEKRDYLTNEGVNFIATSMGAILGGFLLLV